MICLKSHCSHSTKPTLFSAKRFRKKLYRRSISASVDRKIDQYFHKFRTPVIIIYWPTVGLVVRRQWWKPPSENNIAWSPAQRFTIVERWMYLYADRNYFRCPMCNRRRSVPSIQQFGRSSMACHRDISSPFESIQSTASPLLLPGSKTHVDYSDWTWKVGPTTKQRNVAHECVLL